MIRMRFYLLNNVMLLVEWARSVEWIEHAKAILPILLKIKNKYVMRSSKMNLNSEKNKTQFSFSWHASIAELYHVENPIKIERTVLEI